MAERLQCDPEHILRVCYFESRLNPKYRLTTHKFSPAGIVPISQSDALKMGTTVGRISKMSIEDQLFYVEMILQPYTGMLHSITDVYGAIFCSSLVGKTESFTIQFPRKYRTANRVFPIRNHQRISKWQIEYALEKYFREWD